MKRALGLLLAAGTAASVAFLERASAPLGVPGEWAWSRIVAADEERTDRALGVLAAALAAAGYLAAVGIAGRGIERASRSGVAWRLAVLIAAGFGWLWVVQESPPGERRLQKAPLVLYAPSTSGYFFHARFRVDDVGKFLRGYEDWLRRGDVLHLGTHPPGLFLFHRGLTAACDASPTLTRFVLATQPASVREAFSLIDQLPMGAPARLTSADRASLWLAALATQFAAVLTTVPLYLLARRTCTRQTSWLAASLWPLVPALAIFLPKSDALYPFPAALFLWCWLEGARRRSAGLGMAAGLILFAGLFFSLAFLPVALLAAVISAGEAASQPDRRKLWKPIVAGGFAFAAPIVLLRAFAGLNLIGVWMQNYRNHAGFYAQYTRTWWKWLLVNPLETAFAAGWPVALLAAAAVCGALVRRPRVNAPGSEAPVRNGPTSRVAVLGVAAVWGLLWISGKNSGEAARLWLPLFPWAVWLAGIAIERLLPGPRSDAGPGDEAGRWPPLVRAIPVLQAIVAVATILRVTGFDFGVS